VCWVVFERESWKLIKNVGTLLGLVEMYRRVMQKRVLVLLLQRQQQQQWL
jgi:hypothetical protein